MTAATPALPTLLTADSAGAGSTLVGVALLVALAAVVLLVFKVARPRLREQRHRAWEKAGLLPEQLDPEAHARERTDGPGEPRL